MRVKTIICSVCCFFALTLSAQERNIPLDSIPNQHYKTLKKGVIYGCDAAQLRSMINNSSKKFKVIYTFADWCGPCIEKLPKILHVANEHIDELEFYLVLSGEKNKGLISAQRFLNKRKDFNRPIFNLTAIKGLKWSKRYERFIETLAPKHQNYGLGVLMLFGQDNQLVYASGFNDFADDKTLNALVSDTALN